MRRSTSETSGTEPCGGATVFHADVAAVASITLVSRPSLFPGSPGYALYPSAQVAEIGVAEVQGLKRGVAWLHRQTSSSGPLMECRHT